MMQRSFAFLNKNIIKNQFLIKPNVYYFSAKHTVQDFFEIEKYQETINSNKVIIFSLSYCPYCDSSK